MGQRKLAAVFSILLLVGSIVSLTVQGLNFGLDFTGGTQLEYKYETAADLPRNYEANLKPFQFILDVTTDWQESIALAGEVGEFVTIARKAKDSDDWFLGTLTDENKRNVHVDLSFLDAGKKYEAQIYRDGNDANWQTKPYDIIIENKVVTSSDSLTLPLATSGGAAIRFKLLGN